ncbi:hypothetical protein [Pseudoduganella sp.]|uniref:HVO_A0114 family putative DNA-binding protein n=1 Tax=Pseudoduganella sp. TaxID=1880898 RepID=UPI0035B40250
MEELLAWSKELAAKIDNGEPIPKTCVVSYQDPEDLLAVFTADRRKLLDVIVRQAGTISDIAARANCALAEAKENVQILAEAGVVTFEDDVISAIADSVSYEDFPQAAFHT